MSMRANFHKHFNSQKGDAKVIVLVVLAVIALGALGFLSMHMMKANKAATPADTAAAAPAAGETPPPAPTDTAAAPGDQKKVDIEPGDPVVAKIDGTEIKRTDVFAVIQQLPPQMRQLPVDQLFTLAQDQAINTHLVEDKSKGVNLDNDPMVQKDLALAKEQIVRNVFIQKEVDKYVTEDGLKKAYDQYVANFPQVEEVKARHILVDSEDKAKDLIKQLDGGADFAQVAKDNSKDATAANGGDLGFFAKGEVVPEFSDAAFALEPGKYTEKPVKTQFGYHIIKVEAKQPRKPADYETAKPFIEAQLRQTALNELIAKWRKDANVERFDINGKPVVEPAAGLAAPAPAPAGEAPPAVVSPAEPPPAPPAQ